VTADWDESTILIVENPTELKAVEIIDRLDKGIADISGANLWSNREEMAPMDATLGLSLDEEEDEEGACKPPLSNQIRY
jgi:hypothetical protein